MNWRGYPLSYQCLTNFCFSYNCFSHRFFSFTDFWSSIEIPYSCLVKLPVLFTYNIWKLQDPDSGWWLVVYTALAINTSTYVFMAVYNTYLLLALSPHIMNVLDPLDLYVAFSSRNNTEEFPDLLPATRAINFDDFPWQCLFWETTAGRSPRRQDDVHNSSTTTLGHANAYTTRERRIFYT